MFCNICIRTDLGSFRWTVRTCFTWKVKLLKMFLLLAIAKFLPYWTAAQSDTCTQAKCRWTCSWWTDYHLRYCSQMFLRLWFLADDDDEQDGSACRLRCGSNRCSCSLSHRNQNGLVDGDSKDAFVRSDTNAIRSHNHHKSSEHHCGQFEYAASSWTFKVDSSRDQILNGI